MTADPTPIDISNHPDLLRLAEEVEATKKPRELKRDRKTVAILIPVGTARTSKKKRSRARSAMKKDKQARTMPEQQHNEAENNIGRPVVFSLPVLRHDVQKGHETPFPYPRL